MMALGWSRNAFASECVDDWRRVERCSVEMGNQQLCKLWSDVQRHTAGSEVVDGARQRDSAGYSRPQGRQAVRLGTQVVKEAAGGKVPEGTPEAEARGKGRPEPTEGIQQFGSGSMYAGTNVYRS